MKNSKAETIKNLENKLLNFYVPKTYFFNYVDWRNNSKRIFKDIKRVTNKNKIAIRSSAYDEDTDNESQAGKYLSFLNVNKSNKKEVKEKIEKVFKSYGSNIKIKKEALAKYGSEGSGKNLPFSSLSEDLKKKEEDKE